MKLHFYKYQGTGNDFIIMDNRDASLNGLSTEDVRHLCDRRFGIGADGLMLLNKKEGYDFEMKYYNADGREGSMCGNGGRCLVRFADHMGIHKNVYHFIAVDGEHEAEIDKDIVKLKMVDVNGITDHEGDFVLNTGSPHYVKTVTEVQEYDVFNKGMEIRYGSEFAKEGINVNFVEEENPGEIFVRTYERGVEDETFSCGTGVTASAIVFHTIDKGLNEIKVTTKGGQLSVQYDRVDKNTYRDIWLCGPAEKVFEGEVEI